MEISEVTSKSRERVHIQEEFWRTKPVANQHIENKAIPPALVEVWEHMNESPLQTPSAGYKLLLFFVVMRCLYRIYVECIPGPM
jgi:hypothetical protein